MATILVTGGAGYVGSHACKALAGVGHNPVTFDNLVRGHQSAVKWGPLEVGDLLDPDRISKVISKHKPEAVMHFAALALVSESIAKPQLYYRNNVEGTENLLNAMKGGGVNRLVFSSTCAIYGVPESIPVSESEFAKPISPYGDSKLRGERMLAERAKSYGLSYFALRYFNAAGADPEGEIGENHDPEPHLIPNVLAAAAKGTKLTVHGKSYPTTDGTCVRDYVHVNDLAVAHIRALDIIAGDGQAISANLGAGKGYSVMQVIETAERVTGNAIKFDIGPDRPGDPPTLVADTRHAVDTLGWEPKRSDLETLVSDAWRWTRNR